VLVASVVRQLLSVVKCHYAQGQQRFLIGFIVNGARRSDVECEGWSERIPRVTFLGTKEASGFPHPTSPTQRRIPLHQMLRRTPEIYMPCHVVT